MTKAIRMIQRHIKEMLWMTLAAGFLLSFGAAVRANAQITILPPLHLPHVTGVVTDRSGRTVSDAEVVLVRGESVISKTTTDHSGRFSLRNASGRYWLRISAKSYSPASREVVISSGFATMLHRRQLYVMLGPGNCMDDCSPVLKSKKEFDKAVLWNTGHYY